VNQKTPKGKDRVMSQGQKEDELGPIRRNKGVEKTLVHNLKMPSVAEWGH